MGMAHPVLQAFGLHLHEYLLIPSGRGGGRGRARLASASGGCFTCEPPPGVVWAPGTTDRGRDGVISATPPSEPGGRISRTRLSSPWFLSETNHKHRSHVPD